MTTTVFIERRLANDGLSTVSELLLAGSRIAFTLEPGPIAPAHPRKPAGTYQLVLRKDGGIYQHYLERFSGAFADGIPQIIVPGRQWIEVHIGNTMTDTDGCSLVGATYESPQISRTGHYEVVRSEEAYRRIYPMIRGAIKAGPCQWVALQEGDSNVA